jgi:hypothetical protein
MRWARHVIHMGRGDAYTGFWWVNLREKRQLGRPGHRWEHNIKMDLQEMECGGFGWIELAQDRDRWWAFVNMVRTFRFHKIPPFLD